MSLGWHFLYTRAARIGAAGGGGSQLVGAQRIFPRKEKTSLRTGLCERLEVNILRRKVISENTCKT